MPQRVELAARGRLAAEPRLGQRASRRRRSRRTRARSGRPRRAAGSRRRRERHERARRARSTSFHAATTSSAVSRTPACQSSAIARLWSASPTTRTSSATRGETRGHVVATSVMPRLWIRTGTGNSARRSRRAEQVVLPRPRLPGELVGATRDRLRQPVDERQPRVHLDREPAVRRRDEHAPPDAKRFADERLLPLAARRRARSPRSSGRRRTRRRRTAARRRRPGRTRSRGYRSRKRAPSCRPSAVSRSGHG